MKSISNKIDMKLITVALLPVRKDEEDVQQKAMKRKQRENLLEIQ